MTLKIFQAPRFLKKIFFSSHALLNVQLYPPFRYLFFELTSLKNKTQKNEKLFLFNIRSSLKALSLGWKTRVVNEQNQLMKLQI